MKRHKWGEETVTVNITQSGDGDVKMKKSVTKAEEENKENPSAHTKAA